jgi:transposase
MGQERRHFTDEFKRESVALLASSGRSLGEIAGELGISPSMLRNWRNRGDGRGAGTALHPNTSASTSSPDRDGRNRPASPRERSPAHGARHFKKAVAIFSEPPK